MSNAPERMDKNGYNKLHPQKAGPFWVIPEHPRTVLINDDGVANMASMNEVTVAQGWKHNL